MCRSLAGRRAFTSPAQLTHGQSVCRPAAAPCRAMRVAAAAASSKAQQQQHPGSMLAAAALAAAVLTSPLTAAAAESVPTVYFGNGCFWGRQKDFVDTEKALGRTNPAAISALVGYAGGKQAGPDGKVCYYYNADPRTIYERLGHAEVVQVALSDEQQSAEEEFRTFAKTYFTDFQKAPGGHGMMRLDPQDSGAGYRNVVGLPGGVNSPYFKFLQEANVNNMELRVGRGNVYEQGVPKEGDDINVVWVVDSNELPFYRAEVYHQFHNGLGKQFSPQYTRELKSAVAAQGKIGPTGCLELPF
eukprot:GHRR01005561.1.p1 GENE.GHRR01005561.1~~GHRR01005561.1.p1  ORF type:complete len:301 (+),score=93.10 GHRR01005561.1:176-1078(+)